MNREPCDFQPKEQVIDLNRLGRNLESLKLIDPRTEKAMQLSLERYGQINPVVVGKTAEGEYELVDGFKRLRCLIKMDPDSGITVRILKGSPRTWKSAVLLLNWTKRSVSALEEAMVINALKDEERMTQKQIGILLGKDKSWISRRLALVKRLDDEVREHIQLGLIHTSAGRELALLPRGNQPHVLRAAVDHRLTQKELASVVKELLTAGAINENRVKEVVEGLRGAHRLSANPREKQSGGERQMEHALSAIEENCERVIGMLTKWPSQVMSPVLEKWAERALSAADNCRAALEYFYLADREDAVYDQSSSDGK